MLLISGTCSLMARASPSTRDRVPRAPARMPFRLRLPASIQTKLFPRFCSCSSIRLEPAFPIATTQINAATPTAIPRMVRALRSQLRVRATNASRSRALKFMRKQAEVDFTANPHGGQSVYPEAVKSGLTPAASRAVSYGRNELSRLDGGLLRRGFGAALLAQFHLEGCGREVGSFPEQFQQRVFMARRGLWV